jgi:hypothetical protein
LVTVTLTAPIVWAGVVAVIVVLLTTVTPVAALPPTLTVAPAVKFAPVMVTAVPPVIEPVLGDTPLIAGGGTIAKFKPVTLPLFTVAGALAGLNVKPLLLGVTV